MPTKIQQINKIETATVLKKCVKTTDVPQFARYNLIYGFNGSGKTTLSRILRSIEQGGIDPRLPRNTVFQIEMTDGTIVTQNANLNILGNNILVFNQDFINENLIFSEGTASPVYYISKNQKEKGERLETLEQQLNDVKPRYDAAQRLLSQSEKHFQEFKRNTARTIEQEAHVGKRYQANSLASDLENLDISREDSLPENTVRSEQKVALQESPLPSIQYLDRISIDTSSTIEGIKSTLATKVTDIALTELQRHPSMLSWVQTGYEYHSQNEMKDCLFCGNELTNVRLQSIRDSLEGGFSQTRDSVKTCLDQVNKISDECRAILNAAPASERDFIDSLQNEYKTAKSEVDRAADLLRSVLEKIETLLSEKEKSLDTDVWATCDLNVGFLNAETEKFNKAIEEMNKIIDRHNQEVKDFAERKNMAATKLKRHYLAEAQPEYIRLQQELQQNREAVKSAETEIEKIQKEMNEVREQIKQHGPAAEKITHLAHNYLGHSEISIIAKDVGYEIYRGSVKVEGTLSEGEKTAIALCYFIAMIEAEGRDKSKLIAIIDDPVSSLDSRALHYAFSMIRGYFQDVGQLFILTHNLAFKNEAVTWLMRAYRKPSEDNNRAEFFFMDTRFNRHVGFREARLVKMSPLLRDYQSEYMYLFWVVWKFYTDEQAFGDLIILMPNALRKVLEIFLSFKRPGPEGLSNKVERVGKEVLSVDEARVHALNRLVQLESHGDNVDDVISHSSLTLEETREAADALFQVIKEMDDVHFKEMVRKVDKR